MAKDDTFRDKFRTSDEALTGLSLYIVPMPNALSFIAQVADALYSMCQAENWEVGGVTSIEDAVQAAIEMVNDFMPLVGCVVAGAWAIAPNGFLMCDGATYSRIDYPRLYEFIDSAFIVDADNFTVPDLRGRVVIAESDTFIVGASAGEEDHTLSATEMPIHNHGLNTFDGLAVAPGELPVKIPMVLPTDATANAGSGAAHNNMQPYQVLRYAICAG